MSLMLKVMSVVDTIQSYSREFVAGVKIKATGE